MLYIAQWRSLVAEWMPMQTHLLLSQFDVFSSWIFLHIIDVLCIYYLCSGFVSREAVVWSISHGHRCLIQAGESGYGDIYIHIQAPSAFLPSTVGSLFICWKAFFLSGITWMFFWPSFSFFPPSSGLCVGVLPWILFSSTFFLMADTWRRTKAKDEREKWPPAIQNRLAQQLFFFLCCNGLLLERFWQGANILEDSVLSQSSPPHV